MPSRSVRKRWLRPLPHSTPSTSESLRMITVSGRLSQVVHIGRARRRVQLDEPGDRGDGGEVLLDDLDLLHRDLERGLEPGDHAQQAEAVDDAVGAQVV